MPKNDFLPFASADDANVEAQADYAADATTPTGYQPGALPSAKLNKPLRQGTTMAAALAQFICNSLGVDVRDDGDLAGLVGLLTAAIAGSATALFTASDSFASPDGPFQLSFEPDGKLFIVFFDGIEQSTDSYGLAGKTLSLTGGVDPTLFSTVRVKYTYASGQALRIQSDTFGSGLGPFPLSELPNGTLIFVFFDGIEQPDTNFGIVGQFLHLGVDVDPTEFQTVRIKYAY